MHTQFNGTVMRLWLTVGAILAGVGGPALAAAPGSWRQLRIGDAKDWSFIGPAWIDLDSDVALRQYLAKLHLTQGKPNAARVVIDYEAGAGVIAPPAVPFNYGVTPWNPVSKAYDGQRSTNVDLMQAFNTAEAHGDFEAEFKFRWGASGHCDAGFIFRAQDARNYYLAHFPNIGQATRTSHFRAVISKVTDNGWTQVLDMEMLHGVATEKQIWHQAKLVVKGNEFRLWVDGRPMSVVTDDTYPEPGFVGLSALGLSPRIGHLKGRSHPWRSDQGQAVGPLAPAGEELVPALSNQRQAADLHGDNPGAQRRPVDGSAARRRGPLD